MFSIFSKKTPEERFWDWFSKNEMMVSQIENDPEGVMDKLHKAIGKVQEGLTAEIGREVNGKREFVISADGIKERIPAVEKLYDAAPDNPRWVFFKFRQRTGTGNLRFRMGELELGPENFEVAMDPDGDKTGFTVFIKSFDQDLLNAYAQAAFIMLDHAIGEYDMMTKVGAIEFEPFETPSQTPRYSLEELSAEFDKVAK